MDADNRAEVLKQISAMQESSASTTVQIGGVNDNTDMVEHDTLYIQDAPPKVITELSDMGYSLSVTDDGVRVEDYRV